MKIRRNLESNSENIRIDITGADAIKGAGRAWNCRGVKFFFLREDYCRLVASPEGMRHHPLWTG